MVAMHTALVQPNSRTAHCLSSPLFDIYQGTFLLGSYPFALVYQQIASLSHFCLEQADKTLVANGHEIIVCQTIFNFLENIV